MAPEQATWQEALARLAPERSYWLTTVAQDGGPQVSPVWGAVHGDVAYFYSERSTVKARNLAVDPRVALHLGDAEDVLIVYGRFEDLGHPSEQPAVVAAFSSKYTRPGDAAFLPGADPAFDVLYALRPSRALIWQLADYSGSQRRWRADPGH